MPGKPFGREAFAAQREPVVFYTAGRVVEPGRQQPYPITGLLEYENSSEFTADVRELCEARRAKKGEAANARISYTFFKQA